MERVGTQTQERLRIFAQVPTFLGECGYRTQSIKPSPGLVTYASVKPADRDSHSPYPRFHIIIKFPVKQSLQDFNIHVDVKQYQEKRDESSSMRAVEIERILKQTGTVGDPSVKRLLQRLLHNAALFGSAESISNNRILNNKNMNKELYAGPKQKKLNRSHRGALFASSRISQLDRLWRRELEETF